MHPWLDRVRAWIRIGGRRCPHCGAEVSASARTCTLCGASLPAPRRRIWSARKPKSPLAFLSGRKKRTCPHCGAAVSHNAKVCSICEQLLPEPTRERPTSADTPVIEAAEIEVDRQKSRRTCPACGARVSDEAETCPLCGVDLDLAAFEQAAEAAAAEATVIESTAVETTGVAATEAEAAGVAAGETTAGGDTGPTGQAASAVYAERDTPPGKEEAKAARRTCPVCGAAAARTAKQCTVCGAELPELEPVAEPQLPRRRGIRHVWGWVTGGVVLVVVVTSGVLWANRPEPPPTRTPTPLPSATSPPTATYTPTVTRTPTATPTSTSTPTFTPSPTATATETVTPTPTPIIHVVQKGDVLLDIAIRYTITLKELLEANGITEAHILHPGDELIIPASARTPTPTVPPSEVTHVVQQGERMSDIARRYNVSESRIRAANGLDPDQAIQAGDELVIPLAVAEEATTAPTITPTPTPGPPYPAPQMLYPPDDATFWGADAAVMLQWTSVGILGEDEWYEVYFRYLGERAGGKPAEAVVRTRVTSWRVAEEWYPGEDATQNRFEWKVEVVRVTGEDAPSETISSSGFVRRFTWK